MMALHADDWKAISDVLIDRVEKTVDERLDRIERTVNEGIGAQESELKDLRSRVSALEAIKRKAIFVWGTIVFVTTFIGKVIWDEWLGPIFTGKK